MESMGQPDQTRRDEFCRQIASSDEWITRECYKFERLFYTIKRKRDGMDNNDRERKDEGELRSGKSLLLYLVRAIWPKNRRFKWRLAK